MRSRVGLFAGTGIAWLLAQAPALTGFNPCHGQEPVPAFSLSFSPCRAVKAPPGSAFERKFDLVLTTSDNPDVVAGAQGWSLSLSAEGVEIVAITVQGTAAAKVTDNPPGLRDADGGFLIAEVARSGTGACEGRLGAVSAVVLSMFNPVTLPPAGSAVVARVTVSGTAPAEAGQSAAARLFFVDGCGGSG